MFATCRPFGAGFHPPDSPRGFMASASWVLELVPGFVLCMPVNNDSKSRALFPRMSIERGCVVELYLYVVVVRIPTQWGDC